MLLCAGGGEEQRMTGHERMTGQSCFADKTALADKTHAVPLDARIPALSQATSRHTADQHQRQHQSTLHP